MVIQITLQYFISGFDYFELEVCNKLISFFFYINWFLSHKM